MCARTDFYVAEIGDGVDDSATQALLGLSGDVAGQRLLRCTERASASLRERACGRATDAVHSAILASLYEVCGLE